MDGRGMENVFVWMEVGMEREFGLERHGDDSILRWKPFTNTASVLQWNNNEWLVVDCQPTANHSQTDEWFGCGKKTSHARVCIEWRWAVDKREDEYVRVDVMAVDVATDILGMQLIKRREARRVGCSLIGKERQSKMHQG
jgi:hypothetical protein